MMDKQVKEWWKKLLNNFEKKEFSKDNTLVLKGIAILMMMFHHCFWKNGLFKDYSISFFPFNQNLIVDISLTFKICVSIFAFITGYGLILSLKKLNENYDWNKKQIYKWTTNRLIKMLSGFWIIAILAFIICQIINGRTEAVYFKHGIVYGIVQMIIDFLGLSTLFGTDSLCSTWWYMSIAILFIISVPIFAKLFKKFNYLPVLVLVVVIPRILGYEYVDNSYISFLFPLLLGIIFAENNLMVKIANFKIHKNIYVSKILKFIIETILFIASFIIYSQLKQSLFWEIRYGIIPVFMMCYLYEFFIDLKIVKVIFKFLGRYSMDIFLIHSFFRKYYLTDYIYSFVHFIKIAMVLLIYSLVVSIALELFKKIIRYDKLVNKLQEFNNKKIDKYIDG